MKNSGYVSLGHLVCPQKSLSSEDKKKKSEYDQERYQSSQGQKSRRGKTGKEKAQKK